ncbi:MAG: hypothetical protein V1729_06515 [Candidatus Woesearchaeota archaeon]
MNAIRYITNILAGSVVAGGLLFGSAAALTAMDGGVYRRDCQLTVIKNHMFSDNTYFYHDVGQSSMMTIEDSDGDSTYIHDNDLDGKVDQGRLAPRHMWGSLYPIEGGEDYVRQMEFFQELWDEKMESEGLRKTLDGYLSSRPDKECK